VQPVSINGAVRRIRVEPVPVAGKGPLPQRRQPGGGTVLPRTARNPTLADSRMGCAGQYLCLTVPPAVQGQGATFRVLVPLATPPDASDMSGYYEVLVDGREECVIAGGTREDWAKRLQQLQPR
jgi:hypothetical protein